MLVSKLHLSVNARFNDVSVCFLTLNKASASCKVPLISLACVFPKTISCIIRLISVPMFIAGLFKTGQKAGNAQEKNEFQDQGACF